MDQGRVVRGAASRRRVIVGAAAGLLIGCLAGYASAADEEQAAGAGGDQPIAALADTLPTAPAVSGEAPHTVTGAFVSYAPEDQEITMRDDHGEELIFTVDPDTLPQVNGQTTAFDQLHAGDQLTLTVTDDDNGDEYVTAIQVARAPAASATP